MEANGSAIEVARAGVDRVPVLAEVLASAFVTEPMEAWPHGADDPHLVDQLAAEFRALDEVLAEHGFIWEAGEADERVPDEPLWVLDHIGVSPAHQGRGVGRRPVEHGLALADADGIPAFLETGAARNVGYYERFGFRVVLDGDVPDGGPHIWFMRRDPGTAYSAPP